MGLPEGEFDPSGANDGRQTTCRFLHAPFQHGHAYGHLEVHFTLSQAHQNVVLQRLTKEQRHLGGGARKFAVREKHAR